MIHLIILVLLASDGADGLNIVTDVVANITCDSLNCGPIGSTGDMYVDGNLGVGAYLGIGYMSGTVFESNTTCVVRSSGLNGLASVGRSSGLNGLASVGISQSYSDSTTIIPPSGSSFQCIESSSC